MYCIHSFAIASPLPSPSPHHHLFISNASATLDPRDGAFSFPLSYPTFLVSAFLPVFVAGVAFFAKGKWCLCAAIRDLDFNEVENIGLWNNLVVTKFRANHCSGCLLYKGATCEPKAFALFSKFLLMGWYRCQMYIFQWFHPTKTLSLCFSDVNNEI